MSQSKLTISLSGIDKVLPYQESCYAEEAEAIVRAFATAFRLKPHNFEDYNTMSRFLYPGAVSAGRLAAACMVHSIFFFIDDLFFDGDIIDPVAHGIDPTLCTDPRRIVVFIKTLMHIFRTRQLPENPSTIEQAFCFAGIYIAEQAGDEEWFQYLVDTIDDYIDAVLYRNRDLEQHTRDLTSFAEIRERDTGGLHTCVLIQLTNDIKLPEYAREDPMIRRLTSIAVRQASFVNDIISYPKDVLEESSGFNLVKLYMDRDMMSFEDAVAEAIGLVNSYTSTFLALERDFDAEPEVLRYVQGLKDMFCGNIYWELSTGRYRTENSPFKELTPDYQG